MSQPNEAPKPENVSAPPAPARRWECDDCHGRNVQVCVPAWLYETVDLDDTLVGIDWGADQRFYCDDCGDEPSGVTDHAQL